MHFFNLKLFLKSLKNCLKCQNLIYFDIWVKLFSLRIVYKNGHFFREFETILWQFLKRYGEK